MDAVFGDIDCNQCEIDEFEDSKFEEDLFYKDYWNKKPVVIRKAVQNPSFASHCTKSALIRDYGEVSILLATANTHSYDKTESTLRKYIEEGQEEILCFL